MLRTQHSALVNQTMTYALSLANDGLDAVRRNPDLLHGLNTHKGWLTHDLVAEVFDLTYTDPLKALE